MATQLISITDAADLINKSAQTIRRLIKAGKIKYRRKRTPQGFNYLIDKISLLETCGIAPQVEQQVQQPQPTYQAPRQQQPVQNSAYDQSTYTVETPPEIYILESEDYRPPNTAFDPPVQESYIPQQEKPQSKPVMTSQSSANQTTAIIDKLLEQQRIDKDKLYQVLEAYQKRVSVLENQIKQLEGPKKKWWQVWK